jgi:16S rRNA (cytosine1402-N4)-methyltransferase
MFAVIFAAMLSVSSSFRRYNLGKGAFSPSVAARLFSKIPSDPITSYHVPVMVKEVCSSLECNSDKIIVDGTLGGGGHTEAMLQLGAKVLAIDQDDDAIAAASIRLDPYIQSGQLKIMKGNFRFLEDLVRYSGFCREGEIDGILLDLGVSSHQINEPTRGFAFQQIGPLDMRMDTSAPLIAEDLINSLSAEDIANTIYAFGEEGNSRAIAREIVASRPLNNTKDLKDAICRVTHPKSTQKTLARCFQAFRIFVNDELGALNAVLLESLDILRPGGRLAVLSYHSLEDKQVKYTLQNRHHELSYFSKLAHSREPFAESVLSRWRHQRETCSWKSITKKTWTPSDEEIKCNSRSRSAKFRVGEKVMK